MGYAWGPINEPKASLGSACQGAWGARGRGIGPINSPDASLGSDVPERSEDCIRPTNVGEHGGRACPRAERGPHKGRYGAPDPHASTRKHTIGSLGSARGMAPRDQQDPPPDES